MSHRRIVKSELPLTTKFPLYCKHAMPLLWPVSVRTNSQVDVCHTLIVRSPLADTMYLLSKSTTLTAARCPTSVLLIWISCGECMSHTIICRSFEQVTIRPSMKRKWRTASLWLCSVWTFSPVLMSHTRTVVSLEPLTIMFWSYWRQRTLPVCPLNVRVHSACFLSQTLIVLSRRPLIIFSLSYWRQ